MHSKRNNQGELALSISALGTIQISQTIVEMKNPIEEKLNEDFIKGRFQLTRCLDKMYDKSSVTMEMLLPELHRISHLLFENLNQYATAYKVDVGEILASIKDPSIQKTEPTSPENETVEAEDESVKLTSKIKKLVRAVATIEHQITEIRTDLYYQSKLEELKIFRLQEQVERLTKLKDTLEALKIKKASLDKLVELRDLLDSQTSNNKLPQKTTVDELKKINQELTRQNAHVKDQEVAKSIGELNEIITNMDKQLQLNEITLEEKTVIPKPVLFFYPDLEHYKSRLRNDAFRPNLQSESISLQDKIKKLYDGQEPDYAENSFGSLKTGEEKNVDWKLVKGFNEQMAKLSERVEKLRSQYNLNEIHMQNFQLFLSAMTTRDAHYKEQPAKFYAETKKQFEILMVEIQSPKTSFNLKKRVLHDLFDYLGVCGPGVKSHIENANNILTEITSIEVLLAKYRNTLIIQHAGQHIKDKKIYGGGEAHVNNAFLLHAAKLGINQDGFEGVENVNEIFLSKGKVTPEDLRKFEEKFFTADYTEKTCVDQIVTYLFSEISLRLKGNEAIRIGDRKDMVKLFKGIPFVAENPYYFFDSYDDPDDPEQKSDIERRERNWGRDNKNQKPPTVLMGQERLILREKNELVRCICNMLIERYNLNLYEHHRQQFNPAEMKELTEANELDPAKLMTFSFVANDSEFNYMSVDTTTKNFKYVIPPSTMPIEDVYKYRFELTSQTFNKLYESGIRDFSGFHINIKDDLLYENSNKFKDCNFANAFIITKLKPQDYVSLKEKEPSVNIILTETKFTPDELLFVANNIDNPSMLELIAKKEVQNELTNKENTILRKAMLDSLQRLDQTVRSGGQKAKGLSSKFGDLLKLFIESNDIEIVSKLVSIKLDDKKQYGSDFFNYSALLTSKGLIKNTLTSGDQQLAILLIENNCITPDNYKNIDIELQHALDNNHLELAALLFTKWKIKTPEMIAKMLEAAIKGDNVNLYEEMVIASKPDSKKPAFTPGWAELNKAIENKAWAIAGKIILLNPLSLVSDSKNPFDYPELKESVTSALNSIPQLLHDGAHTVMSAKLYWEREERNKLVNLFLLYEKQLKPSADTLVTFFYSSCNYYNSISDPMCVQVAHIVFQGLKTMHVDALEKLFVATKDKSFLKYLFFATDSVKDPMFIIKMLKTCDAEQRYDVLAKIDFKTHCTDPGFKYYTDKLFTKIINSIKPTDETKQEEKQNKWVYPTYQAESAIEVVNKLIPLCSDPQQLKDIWDHYNFSNNSISELIKTLVTRIKELFPQTYEAILSEPFKSAKASGNLLNGLVKLDDLTLFAKVLNASAKSLYPYEAKEYLLRVIDNAERTGITDWNAMTAIMNKSVSLKSIFKEQSDYFQRETDEQLFEKLTPTLGCIIKLFIEPGIQKNQIDLIKTLKHDDWEMILKLKQLPSVFDVDEKMISMETIVTDSARTLINTLGYINNINPKLVDPIATSSIWEPAIHQLMQNYDKLFSSLEQFTTSRDMVTVRQQLMNRCLMLNLMSGNTAYLNTFLGNMETMAVFIHTHPEMDITKPEGAKFLKIILEKASPDFIMSYMKTAKDHPPKYLNAKHFDLTGALLSNSPLLVVKYKWGDQDLTPKPVKNFILHPEVAMKEPTVDEFIKFLKVHVEKAHNRAHHFSPDALDEATFKNDWKVIYNKACDALEAQIKNKEITPARYSELRLNLNTVGKIIFPYHELITAAGNNQYVLDKVGQECKQYAMHLLHKLTREKLNQISIDFRGDNNNQFTTVYISSVQSYVDLMKLTHQNYKGPSHQFEKLTQLRDLLLLVEDKKIDKVIEKIQSPAFEKAMKAQRRVNTLFSKSSTVSEALKFYNNLLFIIQPGEQKEAKVEKEIPQAVSSAPTRRLS